MTLSVSAIETRIKTYEEEIVRLVSNHSALTGALSELKQLLTMAQPVVEVLAPEAAPEVQAIETVVEAVSEVV